MRLLFLCAFALVLLGTALPAAASDWLLTAVPQTEGKRGQVLDISRPFHVILTNATNHNLVVWKDWCSWGYFNLSFEFKGKDGKIIKVEKDTRVGWTRNGPAEFVVLPGCAYTFTIDLLGSNTKWTNVLDLHGAMTMQAIYKNTNEAFTGAKPNPQNKFPADMQKLFDSAWIGQVKSQAIPVIISR
jgi:hypothetical protein